MRGNWVTLNTIAEINPPLSKAVESDDTVAFLPMAAVSEDGLLNRVSYRAASEVVKGYTPFREGDVLLAKITPCMENGKAAIARPLETEFGFGSTEFHVLRAKGDNDPRFLFHAIWNPRFRFEATKNMTGSGGQKRVPRAFLERYRLVCPAPAEQKRIAAILDQADSIRRKRQQALRLTDEFLRSVFLDMFGDPGTNPKKWRTGFIGDLLQSVHYGTSQKAHEEPNGVPVLRMNNITYAGGWDFTSLKYIVFDNKDLDKYLVRSGDLLFNRTNSRELVGKTAVFRGERPMAFAGYLVRAVPKPETDIEYVAAYLNSEHGKKTLLRMCKSIVGMANINAQEMRSIPIPLPPCGFQKKFGDIVRSVESRRILHHKATAEAESLFQCLQHRAFTGQL